MENALRFRIEKAQKEIERLKKERALNTSPYALGLIDGQIMAHKMEIGTLEDLVVVHEILEKRKQGVI